MMRKLLLLLFLIPNLALGEEEVGMEFSLEEYINDKKDVRVLEAIGQMGNTFSWANAMLATKDRKYIYCAPTDIALNRYNYAKILDTFLVKRPDFVSDASAIPLDMALIFALEDKFPCK